MTVKATPVLKVFNFTQDDLDEDDVMMLDTWSQLFIWIGENANKEEKEQSAVIAYEYLIKHPSGNICDKVSSNSITPLRFRPRSKDQHHHHQAGARAADLHRVVRLVGSAHVGQWQIIR